VAARTVTAQEISTGRKLISNNSTEVRAGAADGAEDRAEDFKAKTITAKAAGSSSMAVPVHKATAQMVVTAPANNSTAALAEAVGLDRKITDPAAVTVAADSKVKTLVANGSMADRGAEAVLVRRASVHAVANSSTAVRAVEAALVRKATDLAVATAADSKDKTSAGRVEVVRSAADRKALDPAVAGDRWVRAVLVAADRAVGDLDLPADLGNAGSKAKTLTVWGVQDHSAPAASVVAVPVADLAPKAASDPAQCRAEISAGLAAVINLTTNPARSVAVDVEVAEPKMEILAAQARTVRGADNSMAVIRAETMVRPMGLRLSSRRL
jgi:hypothetical protein